MRRDSNMMKKIYSIIRLFRPHQWLKNLLVIFPPFFAGKMASADVLDAIVPSFAAFSLAASSVYIINDIMDRESDRHHPSKRDRAIANGSLSVIAALFIAAGIGLVSLLIAAAVSRAFEAYLILYMVMTFLYTIYFKNIIILEMFMVSFGFLLRILAGGEAFHVIISGWLFLTVFLTALFLTAGKRLGELIVLSENAGSHRMSLSGYSLAYLEGMLWFSASSTLVTYALYTLEHQRGLFYTVPLTAFGLVRFIYIVKQGKGDPTEALLTDGQILGVGILWVLMIGMIIYR